ncbi:hypothetical protein [Streptomyces cellostaticus]|uniref:hypothetical protein n=1 Tax=Streptomyces cellostaticus TaxID=67285 RepID=UPI002026B375|nr:hypothetical protein [Streptomyces cellostaticus]
MHRPSRPARVLASALATGALLVTAACAGDAGSPEAAPASPAARRTPSSPSLSSLSSSSSSPSSPSASASRALTTNGAKAALITEADIEDDWTRVSNASSWRDKLLVGKVDVASFLTGKTGSQDCQKLIDGLYSDTLLGRPVGASALTGFTEGDARLLYQVGDWGKGSLEKSLDWLKSLPDTCDQFTVTGSDGGKRTVQVVSGSLPAVGDGRQGLTLTVQGTANGEPVTLGLDVAAVRVGSSGILVTNGGPSGVDHDSTRTAVQQGTQRLQQVLAGRTPSPTPTTLD